LATFETGCVPNVSCVVLLFIGLYDELTDVKKTIYYLVLSGVILFSGSIYLLATNDLTAFDFKRIL
jgi:uncharacterized membrane protein YgdD (TMEM256/DUF423 family)